MAKKTSSTWDNFKGHALTKLGSTGMTGYTLYEILKHGMGWKDGGRVRGVGKAKRGFGRAMRKK
jgi:hypothetical protein